MKQVVIKRFLKQEDSTLNRQFEDLAGSYGFKPILCRPYCGQTKGKVARTVQFVRDNFMVGSKNNPLPCTFFQNRARLAGVRFGEAGQRSGASHARRGVARGAKFVPTRCSSARLA